MLIKYVPILMVIGSSLCYHLFQKAIPAVVSPFVTLIVTYIVATVVSIQSYFLFVPKASIMSLTESFRTVNWAGLMLGFAVVGLELGFLLAYRAGWNIGAASLLSNTAVALLLIPIGLFLFRENISLPAVIGVLLCLSGLFLVSRAS